MAHLFLCLFASMARSWASFLAGWAIKALVVGALLALTYLAGFSHGYETIDNQVSWDGSIPMLRPVEEFEI